MRYVMRPSERKSDHIRHARTPITRGRRTASTRVPNNRLAYLQRSMIRTPKVRTHSVPPPGTLRRAVSPHAQKRYMITSLLGKGATPRSQALFSPHVSSPAAPVLRAANLRSIPPRVLIDRHTHTVAAVPTAASTASPQRAATASCSTPPRTDAGRVSMTYEMLLQAQRYKRQQAAKRVMKYSGRAAVWGVKKYAQFARDGAVAAADSTEQSIEATSIDAAQRGYRRIARHTRREMSHKQRTKKAAARQQRTQLKQTFMKRMHIDSLLEQHRGLRVATSVITAPFRAIGLAFRVIGIVSKALVIYSIVTLIVCVASISFTLSAVASPMAIVHASDVGSNYAPLSEICASIDHDAQDKLANIRQQNPHDLEELTGDFTPWPELLAVFATHTVTRRDGKATDVAAFDTTKIQLLQKFYWEMNRIDYHVEVRGSGDHTIRVLVIHINAPTFDGMMEKLHFDRAQLQMAREVLKELQRIGSTDNFHIVYDPLPSAPIGDGSYTVLLREAERHLGAPYKLGTNNAPYEFDCGYFVQYVFNRSGVAHINVRRATQLYEMCQPISPSNAAPGDLVFFHGTYDTPTKCSHVGIYVGNNTMIHSGNPVKYSRIDTPYWQKHFYAFGRLSQ